MEKWSSSAHQGNVFPFPGFAMDSTIASTGWTRKTVQVSFDQVHLHWTARAKAVKEPSIPHSGEKGERGREGEKKLRMNVI